MPIESGRIVLVDKASDRGPPAPDESELLRGPTPDEPYGGWKLTRPDGNLQPVAAPSPNTARTYLAAPRASAAACKEVREAAATRKIAVLTEEPQRVRDADGLYAETTYRLSMPVASPTGDEALMATESVSGLLAGGGMIFLLRRDAAGQWQVAGMKTLWVS